MQLTSTVHARRLYPSGSSGFAALAFARSASATLPRQRTRVNPERGLRFIGSGNVVNRRPIGEIYPSGRKYDEEEIRENVRRRAKRFRKLGLRSSLSMAPDGYKSPINLPALLTFDPLARRASLRSHSARSAQPHCARPRILEYSDSLLWAGATSQAGDR